MWGFSSGFCKICLLIESDVGDRGFLRVCCWLEAYFSELVAFHVLLLVFFIDIIILPYYLRY